MQANNSTNTTEDAELEVAFPHDLYTQASKASVSHPQLLTTAIVIAKYNILYDLFIVCSNLWLIVFFFLKVGERLGFVVQILEQTAALFEEAHNSTSWEEKTVEDFLNVVTQQADGLRSCVSLRNVEEHSLTCSHIKWLVIDFCSMFNTTSNNPAWKNLLK